MKITLKFWAPRVELQRIYVTAESGEELGYFEERLASEGRGIKGGERFSVASPLAFQGDQAIGEAVKAAVRAHVGRPFGDIEMLNRLRECCQNYVEQPFSAKKRAATNAANKARKTLALEI